MSNFSEGPGGTDPNPGSTGGGDNGGLVGTLLQVGGAVYAAQVAKRNTDKTIAANKQQAEYAYSQEQEQWNRQNAYNSPEAQMARYKAAGLNPNLIYGSGSGSSGNATQLPKYNAPSLQYNYKPLVDIPQMLGVYQDFRMRQAQIDNVKAQTENVRSRTLSEAGRNVLLGAQGKTAEWDLERRQYLAPYDAAIRGNEARASEAKLQQEWQRLALMNQQELLGHLESSYKANAIDQQGIDMERKQADLAFSKYRNEWTKMGVTSSDNVLLRVFVRMLNSSGLGNWTPQKGANFDLLKD